jgi:hypothetical protein
LSEPDEWQQQCVELAENDQDFLHFPNSIENDIWMEQKEHSMRYSVRVMGMMPCCLIPKVWNLHDVLIPREIENVTIALCAHRYANVNGVDPSQNHAPVGEVVATWSEICQQTVFEAWKTSPSRENTTGDT